jgi:putative NADH-flavin reductase
MAESKEDSVRGKRVTCLVREREREREREGWD